MKNENSQDFRGLKAYLFPTLVSIISAMIWYDVTEIKQDVKALMAQSNIDKTRIDNLEKQIDKLVASNTVMYPLFKQAPKDSIPKEPPTPYISKELLIDYGRKKDTLEDVKQKPNHA